MLQEGDQIPLESMVLGPDGEKMKIGDIVTGYTVIYFYPKDNTPGCTVEACEFRDFNDDISNLGVEIYGVSGDSHGSHEKFSEKHKLSFPLLSDEKGDIRNAMGVIVKKKMFGREYMGTQRSTFVVDGDGKIMKVWEKVKAQGHAQEVFEYLKKNLA